MMSKNIETQENPTIVAAVANIEYNTKIVELNEAYKRLLDNPDYKLVIEESYFEAEAARVTEILTEPTVVGRDVIDNLVDQLTAIRAVKSHLHLLGVKAYNAKKYIKDEEETIEAIENGTYLAPDEYGEE
jgi:hypothetical protein